MSNPEQRKRSTIVWSRSKVFVESISDLNRAVLNIREINGVTYTQTILGMELKF